MKRRKSLLTLWVIVGLSLLASCTRERVITPSKKIISEDFYVEDFDRLRVASAFDCYVYFKNSEGVTIEANENLIPYIKVEVVGGELRIELDRKVDLRRGAELRAYVDARYLEGIDASGASRVYLRDRLFSDDLRLDVSGASRIKGEVATKYLTADVSGASDLDLVGSAEDMELDASGASNITGYGLETDLLDLNMSGASRAELTNNGSMDIRLSGASVFRYKGNGVIRSIETSGASKVEKK